MPPESHSATQRAFHAALWTADPPAGLTAPDPAEVAQRFRVYRNNVQLSLTRALAAAFPVVEHLVGAAFFAGLARAFIAACPPRNPVLLQWGGDLAQFLAQFPPVAHLPYLPDVARLEHERGQACHAADGAPIATETLSKANPEALRLVLHPSVRLFTSLWPAVQIWRAHQPDPPSAPITPGPDHALIARRPDFSVIVEPLDAGTHAVLRALHRGRLLGEAATLADPTAALTLLLRHGLIIDTGATA